MSGLKRSRRKKGNAVIEFALVASAMVPLLTGVTQFGHSFYMYNQLVSTVKSGARYASVKDYDSTTSTPTASYTQDIKNMVVYGKRNPAPSGVNPDYPIVRGLGTGNVEVSVEMNATVPRTVTVKVVNFTIDSVFRKFTFNGKPTATYPFNGS